MKKSIVFLFFVLFVGEIIANGNKVLINALSNTAVFVETKPSRKFATGFLLRIPKNDEKLLFISNKHVFEGEKTLIVSLLKGDSLRQVYDTVKIEIKLYDNNSKPLYLVPDNKLDIAAIMFDKKLMDRNHKYSYTSSPLSSFLTTKDLIQGQPILFSGYPLSLKVNKFFPLVRSGRIAGIDTLKNIIYIDADIFGGSSGSPVFLDIYSSYNLKFLNDFKYFVGMIAGYVPYKKNFLNLETNQIDMIQTENSGIGIVMPADEILRLCQKLIETN